MGLFDQFKKKKMPSEEEIATAVEATNALFNMDIKEIWSITDQNAFVVTLCHWVAKKCSFGKAMTGLTHQERIVYVVDSFQAEVNNGGFEQYLYNSSGAYVGELLAALSAIGAEQTAGIYESVLASLPGSLPSDDKSRSDVLDDVLTDALSDELFSCDMRFYECAEDIESLLYQFILEHKNAFV